MGDMIEAEAVEVDEERAVVLFVERADEAYNEDDYSWEIILGSFAALAVSGTALYVGLSRCWCTGRFNYPSYLNVSSFFLPFLFSVCIPISI